MTAQSETDKLLQILNSSDTPKPEDFKKLVTAVDSHKLLAKVFLLEGVPFVFSKNPMKYIVFREQVGERFNVGSQDICIVGSAKLGFSPSPYKFGKPFSETSDVDVVLISEHLYYKGSKELFQYINYLKPGSSEIKKYQDDKSKPKPEVDIDHWKKVKDIARNFTYENFGDYALLDI